MVVTSNLTKLSYTQLRALSTTFKRDLTKISLQKERVAQDKVMGALSANREKQDEVARTLWAIEDVRDEAYAAERDFNAAIQEKIKVNDAEAAKDKGKGFKFRLFNI